MKRTRKTQKYQEERTLTPTPTRVMEEIGPQQEEQETARSGENVVSPSVAANLLATGRVAGAQRQALARNIANQYGNRQAHQLITLTTNQRSFLTSEFSLHSSYESQQLMRDENAPITQSTASELRQAVASIATAEVGNGVAAKSFDSDGNRLGWERLTDYFELATGGKFNSDIVKHKIKGQKLPHWCGIFAVWTLKTAGVDIGDWKFGVGVSNLLQPRQGVPEPGDIAYKDQPYQHHAVVVNVKNTDGEIIVTTVNGNSGNNSEITVKTNPIESWSVFYNMEAQAKSKKGNKH